MFRKILMLNAILICNAFAQNPDRLNTTRLKPVSELDKSLATYAVASSAASIQVSKTAFVDGQNVCGVFRISNGGGQSVIVSAIADSLEIHFPRHVPSPALPAGSTRTWFKVADVPISLPGPIAAGSSVTIDYCFSLCLAADFAGANSMRNVVTVSVANQSGALRSFTTRSTSFPPPTLDCQACCLPDDSCTDTVPSECAAGDGLSKGTGTDCASTECTQACCLGDGLCRDETITACQSDGGNALGLGTTCDTAGTNCRGACCQLNGSPACFDDRTMMECDTLQGTFLGPDTTCESEFAACPTGACCRGNGDCIGFQTAFGCDFFASGTFLGVGTTCGPASCAVACCLDDGSCRDETITNCQSLGGNALGFGTTCDTDATTCRPGACCQLNGSPACIDGLTIMECDIRQGTFLGPDTTCESEFAACPTGACCRGNDDCIGFQTAFGCDFFASGTFLGVGTTCGPASCAVACCLDDGSCRDETITNCQSVGGNALEFGTTCDTDATTCRPGACCQLNGSPACIDGLTMTECDIRQGTFLGPDTSCESEFAACPTGACCRGNGDCIDFQTAFGCEFFGSGTFLGVGTTCTNTSCCISLFGSCTADSDCCSGLVCSGGLCDRPLGP